MKYSWKRESVKGLLPSLPARKGQKGKHFWVFLQKATRTRCTI